MKQDRQIRYAVVGLGYIAQAAVLPAFRTARRNSRLTAFVSDDPVKMKILGKKYGVGLFYSYDRYDELLASGAVDAVYIALPNNMHREFSVRAANAGLHVLCEKPMAMTEAECKDMINAARRHGVRLMIAYRLHFENANLEAVKLIKSGRIGEPRIFNSVFTRQVKAGDIRLQSRLGGGTLWDLGIYCINAARYLFQSDPTHVQAVSTGGIDARFRQVDEMTGALLRFPKDRFAVFTSSFGAADTSAYEVIGTKGVLRVEPAYDYSIPLTYRLTVDGKQVLKKTSKHDQFGAELVYFSDCVLSRRNPEPSGREGLIDVSIIRALYKAAAEGRAVALARVADEKKLHPGQKITLPPVRKPALVRETAMSR